MKILRPKQSQQKIGCGHTTFYELIAQGKLPPPVRYGRITGHLEGGDRRLHRSVEGRARLPAEGHRSGPRRFRATAGRLTARRSARGTPSRRGGGPRMACAAAAFNYRKLADALASRDKTDIALPA